jgi:hypothetical protein
VDEVGHSPLHYASRAGWGDGVQLFYDLSPDLSEDAFLDACEAASLSAVKLFLDASVSANSARLGKTAIHHVLSDTKQASITPHEEQRIAVLRVLVERGANVNQSDDRGDTCLHRAARRGEKQITYLLISAGADINARNQAGETALEIAAHQGDSDWIRSLLDAGAITSDATWRNALESGAAALCLIDNRSKIHADQLLQESCDKPPERGTEFCPSPYEVFQHFIVCGNIPRCFEEAVKYLKSNHVLDYRNIHIETSHAVSVADAFKNWWEKQTGTNWVWWLLVAPLPHLRPGEVWIRWRCIEVRSWSRHTVQKAKSHPSVLEESTETRYQSGWARNQVPTRISIGVVSTVGKRSHERVPGVSQVGNTPSISNYPIQRQRLA